MSVFNVIGVGPGDPDLLTIKAAKALGEAKTVIAPRSGNSGESVALNIARGRLSPEAEVIEAPFSMRALLDDRERAEEQWRDCARLIQERLEKGDVAFIVLGDPLIYSTVSYILPYLPDTVETHFVPGISAVNAFGPEFGVPLTQGGESLAVCSMTMPEEELRGVFALHDNILVMKVSANPKLLGTLLDEFGLTEGFYLAEEIGTPRRRLSRDTGALEGSLPYLTTALIKKRECGEKS